MLDARLSRIASGLAALRSQDPDHKLFGAKTHRYELHPRLPEAKVAAFEAKHGVVLPDDYRAFVTRLGNGGAGPYYGVFRLGEMDDNFGMQRWKEGGFVGSLREPFPYVEARDFSQDRPDLLSDDEADALEEEYQRPLNGAFPLCHEGCALRDWLIVTGPERGNLWHDAVVDHQGYKPWGEGRAAEEKGGVVFPVKEGAAPREPRARLGFLDWYEAWLECALAEAGSSSTRGR